MTLATVVRPSRKLADYLSTHASNRLTKAIVALATPQHAGQLAALPSAFPDIKIVSAAVDTVPLGGQRDGFSWMVLEHDIGIESAGEISKPSHTSTKTRAGPVMGTRGWQATAAALRLTSKTLDLAVPLANTLFTTGHEHELHATGITGNPSGVHIDLPELAVKSQWAIQPLMALTPPLKITSAVDNMLKTIDDQPAASFLQDAAELAEAENKEREVFATIGNETIKVIAGGGGLWSPRASMLVLEPPAAPRVGETIQFHLATGSLNGDMESQLRSSTNEVVLEVPSVQDTLADRSLLEYRKNMFLPVFGCGSERGVFVNGAKHCVVGESIHFKV